MRQTLAGALVLVVGLASVPGSVAAQDSANDESPALVVAESLTVAEGDTTGGSYTVELSHQPTVDVTVTVSGQSSSDLTLGGLSTTNTLTFTTENWNTAQTVTVTAANDNNRVDDSVTLTQTAAGGEFDGVSANLAVAVTDSAVLYEPDLDLFFDVNIGNITRESTRLPSGLWGDETTLWISATKLRFDTSEQIITVFEAGADVPRRRVREKEINLGASSVISGLWSDGTTMWVATTDGSTVKAHVLDGGARDSDKDISLDSQNAQPRGLWSDGTTIWVTDASDTYAYAYTLDTGVRDSDSEFDLDDNNSGPGGLWSDGTTIWVTDRFDSYAYAYTLSTGERDTTKEFSTARPGINPQDNGSPHGIWSNGTTIWVVAHDRDELYAFHMTGNPASGGV